MGIFDSLKNIAESTIKREASKTITNAVNSIGKGKNRSERFSFTAIPQDSSELQALPETLSTILCKRIMKHNHISQPSPHRISSFPRIRLQFG